MWNGSDFFFFLFFVLREKKVDRNVERSSGQTLKPPWVNISIKKHATLFLSNYKDSFAPF